MWRTQGSETSQYLQEEKAKAIPPVAASEKGTAQTGKHAFRGCGAEHVRHDAS